MRVVQGPGEGGGNPGDGLGVGSPDRESGPPRPFRVLGGPGRPCAAASDWPSAGRRTASQSARAVRRRVGGGVQVPEHLVERQPRAVGHAEAAEAVLRLVDHRVHGHDVRVLEPPQDRRFAAAVGRDSFTPTSRLPSVSSRAGTPRRTTAPSSCVRWNWRNRSPGSGNRGGGGRARHLAELAMVAKLRGERMGPRGIPRARPGRGQAARPAPRVGETPRRPGSAPSRRRT